MAVVLITIFKKQPHRGQNESNRVKKKPVHTIISPLSAIMVNDRVNKDSSSVRNCFDRWLSYSVSRFHCYPEGLDKHARNLQMINIKMHPTLVTHNLSTTAQSYKL